MTSPAPTEAEFKQWIRDYCDQIADIVGEIGNFPVEIYKLHVHNRWVTEGYSSTLFDKHDQFVEQWFTDTFL